MENNDGSSRGCFDWKNYKNEIYEWYKKLSKIRHFKVMKDGELNILYSNGGKFVFERINDEERIIVLINMQSSSLHIDVEGNYNSFLTGKKINSFNLKENEFEILIEKK